MEQLVNIKKYSVNSLIDEPSTEVLDLSTSKSDRAILSTDELSPCKISKSASLTDFFYNLFTQQQKSDYEIQPSMSAFHSNPLWNLRKFPQSQNFLVQKPPYFKPSTQPLNLNNDIFHSIYLQNLLQSRLIGNFPRLPNPLELANKSLISPIGGLTSPSGGSSSNHNNNNNPYNLSSLLKSSHINRKRKRTKVTDTRLPRRNYSVHHSASTGTSFNQHHSIFNGNRLLSPQHLYNNQSSSHLPTHHHSQSQHHNHQFPSALSSGDLINNNSEHQSKHNSISTNNNNSSSTQNPIQINHFLSNHQHSPNPSNSPNSTQSEDHLTGDPKKYTLTPIHLRKAKLMFLYTRYPNSQMLKSFFPDITFYKQNTAQLVKWFSNFREFYYSEMEKAVQRAISNGVKLSKDLEVSVDSELFKNLMTHFNKKKQITVPCEFLTTVQITIREFFDAISTGKNLHQSWKKPIYKNIAKLDQSLPDFFKDMNWMLELAKDENDSLNN